MTDGMVSGGVMGDPSNKNAPVKKESALSFHTRRNAQNEALKARTVKHKQQIAERDQLINDIEAARIACNQEGELSGRSAQQTNEIKSQLLGQPGICDSSNADAILKSKAYTDFLCLTAKLKVLSRKISGGQ